MGHVEESIEAFAVPSHSDIEVGTKGGAEHPDVGQRCAREVAALDPGALGRGDPRLSRDIGLPPAAADAEGAQRATDAKGIHGWIFGRGPYAPIYRERVD
jgi:hypothetical protein